MAIRYHCPQCHQLLSIATRKAGQPTECPTCGTNHRVPLESEADPQPEVAADAPAEEPPVELLPSGRTHGPLDPAGSSASPFMLGTTLDDRSRHWVDDEEEDEGLVIPGFERKSDEFDLIPLVDCVFLLLVFYMITASYALQKMIDMAAPAADKKGAMQAVQSSDETAQSSLIVQIDAQNRVLIDDSPVPNPADIPDILRLKMNGDQKNILIIEADPRAFHETVVAVTDAAKDLPFQHVRMAVKSAEED
ncbi:MAG TPA: biopolymer transporter ExbD [Planctomycetaceae bacterium]|nr:biopolymer transporter ExbD [Planctomycetaceae bacterium]